MVKYYNYDIVFAEIPDETTLALNITNCPNRCRGCHSPHLQKDIGRILDDDELKTLLDNSAISKGTASPPMKHTQVTLLP